MLHDAVANGIISMIEGTKNDEIQWVPLFFIEDDMNVSSNLKAKIKNTSNINMSKSYYYNTYPGNVVVLSFNDSNENISFWFQPSIYSEISQWDGCFIDEMFVLRYQIREYMERISDGNLQTRNFLGRALKGCSLCTNDTGSVSPADLQKAKKNYL